MRVRSRLAYAREFIASFSGMLKLAWQANPQSVLGTCTIEIVLAFAPVASAFLTKSIFDLLAQSALGQAGTALPQSLLLLLATQAGLGFAILILGLINGYLRTELERKLSLNVQLTVFQKINNLVGLGPFEDPKFHDTIQLGTQGAQQGPSRTVTNGITLVRSSITLTSFLVVLLSLNPLLAGVVSLAALPQLYSELKRSHQRFGVATANSPKSRRASYYGAVLSGLHFAKEVRLFNLAEYFLRKWLFLSQDIQMTQRRQQMSELRGQLVLSLIGNVVATGTFIVIILQAFAGSITLGDVTLYTSAIISVQVCLSSMIAAISSANENSLFYSHFRDLLALPQPLSIPGSARAVPPLEKGIEVRNVSFRYSNQQPWILHKTNLFIPAKQCTALIGLNGAGKTTLVKLLSRLYDPTEGQILWDGVDVREFDPQELRAQIGAILQDFVRYEMTAQENVGIGDVTHVDNIDRIRMAAREAGIHGAITNLPMGYQTPLSRVLVDEGIGVELSGGEWQKIAIARMFMRDSSFLMLDEPTAALDAQAEYNLYKHFVQLMAGRTSLLVTHRFNTAHIADIIAVLENGQITEYGKHEDLLHLAGSYAKLYSMQAERYRESVKTEESLQLSLIQN